MTIPPIDAQRAKTTLIVAMRHNTKHPEHMHVSAVPIADELVREGLLVKDANNGYTITPIGLEQANTLLREWKGVPPQYVTSYEGITSRIGVMFHVDDKVIAQEDLARGDNVEDDMQRIVQLVTTVGETAALRLHGKDGQDYWHNVIMELPQPGHEHQSHKPIFDLFARIVDGTESAHGWAWYFRRIDDKLVFVQRDKDGVLQREIVTDQWAAYVSAVRAHHYGRDTERAFGSLFATFGIPYRNEDAACELNDGTMPTTPPGAAEGERAVLSSVLRASDSLLDHVDRWTAEQRETALAEHVVKTTVVDTPDDAPERAKSLVQKLRLHPVVAEQLATWLNSSPDQVALLAQALKQGRGRERDAIDVVPPKPTWEQWRKANDHNIGKEKAFFCDDVQARAHFYGKRGPLAQWERKYGKTSVMRSNNLTKRAIRSMTFVWPGRDDSSEMWDEAREQYEKRIQCESAEDAIRLAVRPWPADGWRGVEVGTTCFGRYEKWLDDEKCRRSATPHDLYRLMYLFRPHHVDFTDMYKDGLFGLVSPCGRFAASFYLYKYELAGSFKVEPELAKRTRPVGNIEITCGVPGSNNGVATTDKDALRWFRMITLALHRKWDVYSGNNFVV